MPHGFQRIVGVQAPRHQYVVDDHSAAFSAVQGNWTERQFEHGYSMSEPSTESDFPPYWHHFEVGAHTAPQGAVAHFDLQIPLADTYNVSVWWPAAQSLQPEWSNKIVLAVQCGPSTLSTTAVNIQSRGDEWAAIATDVPLTPGCILALSCAGVGLCIADAVLVEGRARYNDGSVVSGSVSVAAMDAIVLARAGSAGECSK
jgi:hypothetical protein